MKTRRRRHADAAPPIPRRDHSIEKEPQPDSRAGCHRLGGIGQGNFGCLGLAGSGPTANVCNEQKVELAELYNLIREGRGLHGVPLILIGLAP